MNSKDPQPWFSISLKSMILWPHHVMYPPPPHRPLLWDIKKSQLSLAYVVDWKGKALLCVAGWVIQKQMLRQSWHRGNYEGSAPRKGRGKKRYWVKRKVCDASMIKPKPIPWGPQEQILPIRVSSPPVQMFRSLYPCLDQLSPCVRQLRLKEQWEAFCRHLAINTPL